MLDFWITEYCIYETIFRNTLWFLKRKKKKENLALARLEFQHCENLSFFSGCTSACTDSSRFSPRWLTESIYIFSCYLFFSPCNMFLSANIRPALWSRGWHLVSQWGANLPHCSHGDGCACVHHISLLQEAVIVALCRVQEFKWKERVCCEGAAFTPLPSGCACRKHMASLWVELGATEASSPGET